MGSSSAQLLERGHIADTHLESKNGPMASDALQVSYFPLLLGRAGVTWSQTGDGEEEQERKVGVRPRNGLEVGLVSGIVSFVWRL